MEASRQLPGAAARKLCFLRRPGWCALVTCAAAVWSGIAPGGSGPEVAAAASLRDVESDPGDSPQEKEERRRIAVAMVYIVAGIAVGGIALIVLIILGGHRVRRQVRSRTGRAGDLDPLWYLRSAGKHVSEPGGAPPESGERADESRDGE